MPRDLTSHGSDPLAAAAEFARRCAVPVYLVGGAVRDRLAGRRAKDFDFAVARGEEDLARHFQARGFGRPVRISREESPIPVWRLSHPPIVIDVARFEAGGSVEQDLARRDFTINAIAIEAGTGRRVDPFGGRLDLRRGLIRSVAPGNLAEDPLRLLRAYRLAATHGLRIAPTTRRAIRSLAPLISRCAVERIHDEIVRLFGASSAERSLREAARDGVVAFALGLGRPVAPSALRGSDRLCPEGPAKRRLADRLAVLLDRAGVAPARAGGLLERRAFSRAETRETLRRLRFLREVRSARRIERTLFRHREHLAELLPMLERAARSSAEKACARRARDAAGRCRLEPAPVTGSDIASWLKLPEGPELGRALDRARWLFFLGKAASREAIRKRLRGRRRV